MPTRRASCARSSTRTGASQVPLTHRHWVEDTAHLMCPDCGAVYGPETAIAVPPGPRHCCGVKLTHPWRWTGNTSNQGFKWWHHGGTKGRGAKYGANGGFGHPYTSDPVAHRPPANFPEDMPGWQPSSAVARGTAEVSGLTSGSANGRCCLRVRLEKPIPAAWGGGLHRQAICSRPEGHSAEHESRELHLDDGKVIHRWK